MKYTRDAILKNIFFIDKPYDFGLKIKQLIELQESLDMGPVKIYEMVQNGEYRIQHLQEIVRLGLIGGGTEPEKAYKFVNDEDYFGAGTYFKFAELSQLIMMAALTGVDDEIIENNSKESSDEPDDSKKNSGSSDHSMK